MDDEREIGRRQFRVLSGGRDRGVSLNSVRVVVAPEDEPPFDIDALVVEEDTWLVMSADMDIQRPDHVIRVMTEVLETAPEEPGTIVVRGTDPFLFLAVVHDFNEEPSCTEDWIAAALDSAFHEAEQRALRSIGLPLLGTLHGNLETDRFLALFKEALDRASLGSLKTIWLIPQRDSSWEFLSELDG